MTRRFRADVYTTGVQTGCMEIREARTQDRPALRDVARRSLQASYPIDTKAILVAVDEWYHGSHLNDMIRAEEYVLLVADVDGQIVAFSDAEITGEKTGELYWLHVDPDYRSENYGEKLFEKTRSRLAERGAMRLQGRVLDVNRGGNAFYKRHGLTKVGTEEVNIDGTPYIQNIYTDLEAEDVEEFVLEDRTIYINKHNTERGSLAPFYIVYTEPDGEEIYGYWCSNCENPANAMDAMGRIQCDECGNTRKPTRWDAAYL